MNTKHRLVADIGGTNARFALCEDNAIDLQTIQTLNCSQFNSLQEAIQTYLSAVNRSIGSACLAVAGPVKETVDRVNLTNSPWSFSQDQLKSKFGFNRLICVNDFAAAAMATTVIHPDDLFFLSENKRFDRTQQRCILGPGTGLGVAGMVSYQAKTLVLSTEGGNRSFSPENKLEDYILNFLRSEMQPVSCEMLLSGNGLVNIYRALCNKDQQACHYSKPADIAKAVTAGEAMAKKTFNVFFEILGSVAGDCALTFGATGGVYIGGGIVPKFSEQLLASNFRERFENKLNYRSYLSTIPTAIVTHPHPGLIGAAAYLKSV